MFFPEIVSMHFQLTGRCNLKCVFCGQQNGMFSGSHREELPYEKWIAIAEEVRNLGSRPEIILWGGEPLLYSRFDELAEHLHRMGFDEVYDTTFSADLTVMEESKEFLERLGQEIFEYKETLKKLKKEFSDWKSVK